MDNGCDPMTNSYEKPHANWLIRLGGLAAIGISALAALALHHHLSVKPPHEATPVEMVLACVAFAAASVGAAMTALGRHLFDRIEVANPWEQYFPRFFRRSRIPGIRDESNRHSDDRGIDAGR